MNEVVLVLGQRILVEHVVPTLKPHEACPFGFAPLQLGKFLSHSRQGLFYLGQHLLVVGAGFTSRGGRAKILVQALAPPSCLDQQHRFLEVVAQYVPDLQFGPDVVPALVASVSCEPDAHAARHHPLLVAKADKGVVSLHPVSLLVLQVGVALGVGRILHDPKKGSLPAVVVFRVVHVDHALALHVGLPRKQEYLYRLGGVRGNRKAGEQESEDEFGHNCFHIKSKVIQRCHRALGHSGRKSHW